ncbi:hypothetical protein P692DRAFT_20715836, partial [Suillus brevipes Sb2]
NLYEAMKASSSVFPCTCLRCRHEPPGEFVSNSLNRLSCFLSLTPHHDAIPDTD